MKSFIIFGFAVLYVAAAPTTFLIRETAKEPAVIAKRPEIEILKQINQANEDGSYTFGFEAADGSYRKETRDVHGHVTGRYGYIDVNGQRHELEYVSGQHSGKTIGFQIKSATVPVSVAPVAQAPVVQKQLNYQYSSVNVNQDAQPDVAGKVVQTPTVVRYVQETPKYVVHQAKSTVVPVAPAPVNQKVLDFQYSSVDDNEDGQPDVPAAVVRVEQVPIVQTKQTVVPVIVASTVDQKQLDYHYSSVDDNQDGRPDASVQVAQAPTVVQYVQEAPVQRYIVHQVKSTVVPVASASVDQKTLDYQYSSVDDNQDGQPDDAVKEFQAPTVVQYVQEAPKYVVHQVKNTVVPVASASVDQKTLDYQYSSVDENQDGHPDDAVKEVQAPTVVQYVQEAPRYVVHQVKNTVVPVAPPSVDQKALDYRYSSVDDNEDGQPDDAVKVVQTPTVVQYVQEAPTVVQYVQETPRYIVHETKSTVIPVAPLSVDQKALDYQYSSVDDNEDGLPDAAAVIRVEQVPVVQTQQSVVQILVGKTSVDQKHLDYRYSSVDDNQDGQPDAPVREVVVQAPTVVEVQPKQTVVPVSVVAKTSSVDQKALDYRYSSVDDNQDGIPDAAEVIVQQPTIVRYEQAPVYRVIQTVVPAQEIIAHPTVVRTVHSVSNGPVDQFVQDLRYHSVDVDEDGIPDEAIEVKSLPVVIGRII